jgi:hypothetical protein
MTIRGDKETVMITSRWCVWISLLVAAFVGSAVGCASSGMSKTIGPNDLPTLAGKWAGTINLPSGRPATGTLDLSANGDYVVQAAGFGATGKAQVKDGQLVLVPTTTSGGGGAMTGPRSSTAALSQRPDGSQVLTGDGHSGTGPFSFEVVRQK